jgi:hypothetical protein
MSKGDEPANLSAIAPPKMVLPMSLQLSYGTAAETDFQADRWQLAPRLSFVNSICRDSRIVANGRYRVDLTRSSRRWPMTAICAFETFEHVSNRREADIVDRGRVRRSGRKRAYAGRLGKDRSASQADVLLRARGSPHRPNRTIDIGPGFSKRKTTVTRRFAPSSFLRGCLPLEALPLAVRTPAP